MGTRPKQLIKGKVVGGDILFEKKAIVGKDGQKKKIPVVINPEPGNNRKPIKHGTKKKKKDEKGSTGTDSRGAGKYPVE